MLETGETREYANGAIDKRIDWYACEDRRYRVNCVLTDRTLAFGNFVDEEFNL